MPFTKIFQRTAQTVVPLTDQWRTDVQTEVTAYRSGDVVTVSAWRLSIAGGVTGDVLAYTLPLGFRPAGLTQSYARDSRDKRVALSYNGAVAITDPSGPVAHHSFTFVTLDPMPKGGA